MTTWERNLLRIAGGLFVGGFVLYFAVTRFHPAGDENHHPTIFQEYADSDPWVIVHFGQFVALLVSLFGFVVLYWLLRQRAEVPMLARAALASTVAAAAVWAVLQAVDGVALKETVEAWSAASGAERDVRFADAETVRWTEWGLQAYFRLLLGLTFVLFGVAIARTGFVARWLGGVAILTGVLYMTVGIAVGHSGFEQPGGPLIQLLFVVFFAGVLVTGVRGGEDGPRAAA